MGGKPRPGRTPVNYLEERSFERLLAYPLATEDQKRAWLAAPDPDELNDEADPQPFYRATAAGASWVGAAVRVLVGAEDRMFEPAPEELANAQDRLWFGFHWLEVDDPDDHPDSRRPIASASLVSGRRLRVEAQGWSAEWARVSRDARASLERLLASIPGRHVFGDDRASLTEDERAALRSARAAVLSIERVAAPSRLRTGKKPDSVQAAGEDSLADLKRGGITVPEIARALLTSSQIWEAPPCPNLVAYYESESVDAEDLLRKVTRRVEDMCRRSERRLQMRADARLDIRL